MLTSDDKVGGWVKKGQNHDDVILEWSLTKLKKKVHIIQPEHFRVGNWKKVPTLKGFRLIGWPYKILSQPLVDSLGRLLIPFGLHITCLKAVSDEALFSPQDTTLLLMLLGPVGLLS